MSRQSLLILVSVCAVVGVLLVRLAMWSNPEHSGLLHHDVYPEPALAPPPGTHAERTSAWRAGSRANMANADVAITFPPDPGQSDSSRYTGVLSEIQSDTGRVVLVSGPSLEGERERVDAVTRPGQRCLFVAGLDAPSDSLIVLLTRAAATIR